MHLRRAEVHAFDRTGFAHLGQGAGLSDLHRQGGDAVDLGGRHQVAAGKAPRPIGDHPHAKALCAVQRELLYDAILDGDALCLAADNSHIGIRCSAQLGQVQSAIC